MGDCPRLPSPWTASWQGLLPCSPAHCPGLILCPSFQIPVTQACLMEDIEQWLSTDVVSQGLPSPEAEAQAPSSPT